MTFTNFGLHKHLIQACEQSGFTTPTPIQEEAIPALMAGHDLMACAQTGTGKTAAFTLPLISKLLMDTNNKARGPKALILTPTRELAEQILESIQTFTKGTQLKTGVIVGGVSYGPQLKMLSKPLDILVATPGRLIDHMGERKINLEDVKYFILDEADRMLDMGFVKPVERIAETTNKDRQTMLFSATFSPEVERLVKRFLTEPKKIRLANATEEHTDITQSVYMTPAREHKTERLQQILDGSNIWQAIIFMRTKHAADRMAKTLSGWGHDAAALHGDMKQSKRKKVTEQMHKGNLKILVATDVAARGLDVKALSHVINFDLPQVAEDYIHRIGRTGRAGAKGTAISFVSNEERKLLSGIEKLLGRKLDVVGGAAGASRGPKGGTTQRANQPAGKGARGGKPQQGQGPKRSAGGFKGGKSFKGKQGQGKPEQGQSTQGQPTQGKPEQGKPTQSRAAKNKGRWSDARKADAKKTEGRKNRPWQNKPKGDKQGGKGQQQRSQRAN